MSSFLLGLLSAAHANPSVQELAVQDHTIQLVHVPAGSFQMGSPADEADRGSDERLHTVTLQQGFHITSTEITQGVYAAVMGETPWTGTCYILGTPTEGAMQPAACVTWSGAARFCNALSALEGRSPVYSFSDDGVTVDPSANGYRLPSEAQWEYAARAGEQHRYAGSDDIDAVGWHQSNSSEQTHPVGNKAANAWGLHDMTGNLWEWTGDWYDGYGDADRTDPTGPASGGVRVIRGGAYTNPAGGARVAMRMMQSPEQPAGHIGFRVVRPD